MCGIYGMVASAAADATAGEDPTSILAAMDAAMVHRGPDDSGTLIDGRCAMGMRRLSIIDLGGGRQPIANEDRTVWVVFNGEIYNHQSLRRHLIGRGHRFTTASDTETLVHNYEEKGAAFVDDLRGMFAAAVWDRRARRLTLVRDRLGIKPLYYADTPKGLVWSSEMKSLLTHPWVGRELDPEALSHYLSFGTLPSDRGILKGVSKLPPGHTLIWDNGDISIQRYWDLRPSAEAIAEYAGMSEAEGAGKVRALLKDAVESHLIADVEVGAFLSGGIDSGTVVGLMAEAGARPRTFSIGFDEADFDELRYARIIAKHFGTRHEELVVRPDAWQLLDQFLFALDEPLADVSAIPTWFVSQLAAKQVKVVLSGDGGDEVFGGYTRYPQALAEARRFDGVGRAFPEARGALARLAAALPEKAYGKYWLRHAALDPRLRYVDGESLFLPEMKERLLSADLLARLPGGAARGVWSPVEERARLLESAPGDALGRLLYLDTMTYLPLDILAKVDRMSMAHSLEVRPPLLDAPLVEAVAAMPSSWKVLAGEQKRILKRAVAGLVPREIVEREKRGFGVPIRHWFRGGLKDAVRDVLLADRTTRTRGLFRPEGVEALVAEHLSGRRDQSLRIWSLLVLELWLRAFVDARATRALPTMRPARVPEIGGAASASAVETEAAVISAAGGEAGAGL